MRKVWVVLIIFLLVAAPAVSAEWRVTKQGLVLGDEDRKEDAIEVRVEKKEDKEKLELEVDEEELGDQDELEIEDEDGDDDVKLATGEGKMVEIRHRETKAQTELPISVNVATRAMTVTTPAGVKTVSVLPNAAVTNMLAGRFAGSVASGSGSVQIKMDGNRLVYEIETQSEEMLLGLVPVKIARKVKISAENGATLGQTEDFFNRILDILSL